MKTFFSLMASLVFLSFVLNADDKKEEEEDGGLRFGVQILNCFEVKTLVKSSGPKKKVDIMEYSHLVGDERTGTVVSEYSAFVGLTSAGIERQQELKCQGDPYNDRGLNCDNRHQSRPAGFLSSLTTEYLDEKYVLAHLIEQRDLVPATLTIFACRKPLE